MITVIVNFPSPDGASVESMAEAFNSTAPNYEGLPGLVRKYYLFDPDTQVGGGVYLWESRAQAEAFYDETFQNRIKDKYGSAPVIRYFESPVIVDNAR